MSTIIATISAEHSVCAFPGPNGWVVTLRILKSGRTRLSFPFPGNAGNSEAVLSAGLGLALAIENANTPDEWVQPLRDVIERPLARKTPHEHWSHYDEHLEMRAWNEMLALLASVEEVDDQAERLVELAGAYGYGEADVFLTESAEWDRNAETPEQSAIREQYVNYMDGDYWNCIDASSSVCQKFLPEPNKTGRDIVNMVAQDMRDAYEAGRARRETESVAPDIAQ